MEEPSNGNELAFLEKIVTRSQGIIVYLIGVELIELIMFN